MLIYLFRSLITLVALNLSEAILHLICMDIQIMMCAEGKVKINCCVYIQSAGNVDSEDACYEFKQEQDLTHRTHLYYLDYDFSQVS